MVCKITDVLVVVALAVVALPCTQALLKDLGPVHDPADAVKGLISRVIGPDYVDKFEYQTIPADPDTGLDVFELSQDGDKIVLAGNTGVAMASGLYWYMRYYCHTQVTWGWQATGNQVNMPNPLPAVSKKVRVVNEVPYRYYMNVCTVSYSMAWWNWTRWEQDIDWMALHGINLPLSFAGQEAVWYDFYKQLGLNDTEIQKYFAGPAFLAWQRMGNIRGWAGPLDTTWREMQRDLQLKILQRQREFGMVSVLPGFSGHVPEAISRIYPEAKLIRSHPWNNFNDTFTGDYLLEPNDPTFAKIAQTYYQTLIKAFGTDHVYNSDTYNEMDPSSTDLNFLKESNVAVYDAMRAVDPKAVYLMQGWLFLSGFWSNDRVEAYLSGIPDDGMLILDLFTESTPIWSRTNNYFGKKWIWCMLHNFGGRRGLYGNLTHIAVQPHLDFNSPNNTMTGLGITPEAIENNPIMYEMLLEQSWRSQPVDVPSWVEDYAHSRYGVSTASTQAAWTQLLDGAYNQPSIDTSQIEAYPAVGDKSSRHANATAITEAWRLLTTAANNGDVDPNKVGPFRYDLVDVGRQALSNLFADVQLMTSIAYQAFQFRGINSTARVFPLSDASLAILKDMDELLGTDINYLLGVWIDSAKAWGNTSEEIANREFNARNQITLWGPRGEINDYAAKHWNGLVGDYYYNRWNILFTMLRQSVQTGQPADFQKYGVDQLNFEQGWSNATKPYPSQPSGDPAAISQKLVSKYAGQGTRYKKVTDTDICGTIQTDIMQAWTTDVFQLTFLCDLDPTCIGFNSNGWMKNVTTGQCPTPGCDLYLKP